MAKKEAAPTQNTALPHLAVATVCEQVLQESDQVLSAIRIVDMVGIPDPGPAPPLRAELPLKLLIIFKAGDARGPRDLLVSLETPDGKKESLAVSELTFVGREYGGVAVQMPVRFKWGGSGTYWYNILIGNHLLTRVPLHINVEQAKKAAKPANRSRKRS